MTIKTLSLVTALVRPWCFNVDTQGFGTSVVRGPTEVGRFSSWGTVVPKDFLAESAYFSSQISHSVAS